MPPNLTPSEKQQFADQLDAMELRPADRRRLPSTPQGGPGQPASVSDALGAVLAGEVGDKQEGSG